MVLLVQHGLGLHQVKGFVIEVNTNQGRPVPDMTRVFWSGRDM